MMRNFMLKPYDYRVKSRRIFESKDGYNGEGAHWGESTSVFLPQLISPAQDFNMSNDSLSC